MYAEMLMLTGLHKAGSLSSKIMNFVIGARESRIMPNTLGWAGVGAVARGPLKCGIVVSVWLPSAPVGELALR